MTSLGCKNVPSRIGSSRLMIPTVAMATPNIAAIAAIIREPLEGRDFAAPLPPDTEVPIVSAGAVVRGFVTLHALPADRLPTKRALNLPAMTVSVAEMVAAATRAGATGRITSAPDAATQAIVSGWPRYFVSRYARGLGIGPDADIDALISDYLANREV